MSVSQIISFAGGTATVVDANYNNGIGQPLSDIEAANLLAQTAASREGMQRA